MRQIACQLLIFVTTIFDSTIAKNGLPWEEKTVITIGLSLNDTDPESQMLRTLRPIFECEDTYICKVRQRVPALLLFDGKDYVEQNVTIEGLFIGKTRLVLHQAETTPVEIPTHFEEFNFEINILRTVTGQVLTSIMTGVMIFVVIFLTFMMGTQLKIEAIKKCVARPIGPATGLICQYFVMPLTAWFWATVLVPTPSLQFGFFAVGCAPGGGNSNMWSILLDGNLDLSITMTFFSNVAAIGLMPVWLYTVGRSFYGGNLVLPFDRIAMSLSTLIIPGALGILFAHKYPSVIPKARRVIKIFTLCFLVFVIGFASYSSWYIFLLMRWYTILPGLLLPLTGYVLGYGVAFVLRQSHRNARTIAIETGIQNGSISMVVCLLSLGQPDADLTIVMPVCVMMFTTWPLLVWLIVRTIRRRYFGYIDPDLEEDDNEPDPEKTVTSNGNNGAATTPQDPNREMNKNGTAGKKTKANVVVPANNNDPPPTYLSSSTPKESEL